MYFGALKSFNRLSRSPAKKVLAARSSPVDLLFAAAGTDSEPQPSPFDRKMSNLEDRRTERSAPPRMAHAAVGQRRVRRLIKSFGNAAARRQRVRPGEARLVPLRLLDA